MVDEELGYLLYPNFEEEEEEGSFNLISRFKLINWKVVEKLFSSLRNLKVYQTVSQTGLQ